MPISTIGTILTEQPTPPDHSYHIALVAPFPPPYGGMGTHFTRLADELDARGHRCRRVRIEWPESDGSQRLFDRVRTFIYASGTVTRARPDVVHCVTGSLNNAFAMGVVLLAARVSRLPAVLSIGGGFWDDLDRWGGRCERTAASFALRLANRVIVCNEDLERSLRNLGIPADKVIYFSNALPDEVAAQDAYPAPAEFEAFVRSHSPVVLCVGGMHQNYGLVDAVAALANLREGRPRIGLAAFVKRGGDPHYKKRVLSLVERLGLSESVVIYESVPWAVAAMRASDVMLRCTRTSEGDSIAVREALSVAVPVVASDVGYRPSQVRTYRATDVDDMIHVLDDCLGSEERPQPYTDDEGRANIAKYEGLYGELVHSGSGESVRA